MPKSKKPNIETIGISTGGGDAPGLNTVIRAAVRKVKREYGWRILGIRESFEGLITGEGNVELTEENVKGILAKGGTVLGTSNRGNPFSYPSERGGKLVAIDLSGLVLQRMTDMKIDALMLIGGDGTMRIAERFHELDCPVVGVPKTIDNDLLGTDRTFGFETAVDIVTWALDKLHSTAESHDRVMVVEVMGREAGWIALTAGIAGGADVILVPEIPFTYQNVAKKIHERRSKGRDFSIVVVAEGAKLSGDEDMTMVDQGDERFGLPRLGGIGYRVREGIEHYIELETRVVVLGHLQRGGSPNAFDRVLASRLGCAAVDMIAEGKFGHMASIKGDQIVTVPIKEATAGNKLVNPKSELVKVARSLGISFGDQ
jgi:phosphofructokinase-like protein